MLNVYFAFAGATGNVLNYFGNSDAAIGGLTVTRKVAGQYTCVFLTKYNIQASQQPIIQVTSSGLPGTAGINNVVSHSVVTVPTMSEFKYQVTLNIETYGGAPDPNIMMVAYAV